MQVSGLTNLELNAVRLRMRDLGIPNATETQVREYVMQAPDDILLMYPGLGRISLRRLRSVWPYRPKSEPPAMRPDDV